MASKSQFALPTSSYEVIAKILHGYALCGDKPATLKDVSAKAGINRTRISGNNAFLTSLGLLEGGKRKTLTPRGRDLALAIANGLQAEAGAAWSGALMDVSPTKSVLEMIRVQNGVNKKDLAGKIAKSLDLATSQSMQTKTGINALIEIATRAGVLEEVGDKYLYCASSKVTPLAASTGKKGVEAGPKALAGGGNLSKGDEAPLLPPALPHSTLPGVHIDVQIHVAADARPEQIDQIFASLAKHLYQRG
ncbi:MAG TPA: hypothetical protein PK435_15525 [Thermoanaerobaculaceae bacterium]|nr:hypothetical protein [Thermoanaerobaculaceae bacterium]